MRKYFILLSFLLPFLVNAQTNNSQYVLTVQDRKDYVLQLAIDPIDMNNPSMFDFLGRAFIPVRLTLKNNSNDTLKFWDTYCSGSGFYKVDNKSMQIFYGVDCASNYGTIVSLNPYKTRSMRVQLLFTKNASNYKFRIGMPLFKCPSKYDSSTDFRELLIKYQENNMIWSNEVDLVATK